MFSKLAALLFILPVTLLAQEPKEDLLKLNDIVITGSSIGGDVTISRNPSDGSYEDPQISTQGNVTFDNGCTFENENVYECDGTQRQMNLSDKKKLIKRHALIQRKQKKMGSSSKKNHPKNSKAKPQKASRAQKTRNNNNKRGLVRKHNLDPNDEGCDDYAPCSTC